MARILQHESRDVDDQAKALNDWQQSYEQLGCGRFRGSAWQLVMDQGVLLRESTNRPLAEHITPPKDHLVLALPVTVEPGSVFSGRPMERDSLMVLSDREQYDVISAGALDLIGLSVHSDTVAATLAPSKNGLRRRSPWMRPNIFDPGIQKHHEQGLSLQHLHAQMDAPTQNLCHLFHPQYEDRFYTWLYFHQCFSTSLEILQYFL